ncbi:hypothetical protein QJQ45_020190, partial [Haematococcus lacustris]
VKVTAHRQQSVVKKPGTSQGKHTAFPAMPSERPDLSEAEASLRGMKVCVTGGGGYIASHIVWRLLAAGATVHATVREIQPEPDTTSPRRHPTLHPRLLPPAPVPTRPYYLPWYRDLSAGGRAAWDHLRSLPGGSEEEGRLLLFQADLLQVWAMQRFRHGGKLELPAPAVWLLLSGVKNVISSLSHTDCHSVTSLVLTSSVAACFTDPHERGCDHTFTEGSCKGQHLHPVLKPVKHDPSNWDLLAESNQQDNNTPSPAQPSPAQPSNGSNNRQPSGGGWCEIGVPAEADWNVLLDQPGAAEGPLAYWYSKAAAEQVAVKAEAGQGEATQPAPRPASLPALASDATSPL